MAKKNPPPHSNSEIRRLQGKLTSLIHQRASFENGSTSLSSSSLRIALERIDEDIASKQTKLDDLLKSLSADQPKGVVVTFGVMIFALLEIVISLVLAVILFSVPKEEKSTPRVIAINFGAVGFSAIAFWTSVWLIQASLT